MLNLATLNANPWKAAASDPDSWHATTFERADELLCALPPMFIPHGFVVMEPIRHDDRGRAVYLCVVRSCGNMWVRELAIEDTPAAVVALRQAP